MLDPANKPSNTGIKLLLLGDDNLGWLPEMFGEYINSGEFTKDARKLGLIAKAKISKDIYDAEYCSSRLWCLHDDIWVSGPKLGRMWTRFGVTNTQFKTQEDTKQWLICNAFALRFTAKFIPGVKEWISGILTACSAPNKFF